MTETRAARRGRDVRNERARARAERDTVSPRYKWVVLSNTTLGVLIATINSSILLIALPDIFRGIHINPLEPGNTSLLLWLIMGYMVVTAVLVVGLGRLGDMYGRVRIYNAGFAIFTFFSIMLAVTWMHGVAAALWLVAIRIFQGVGGAMLMANSSAIITDAFPPGERGLGLGLNMVAAIAGSFIGLIVGGLLAPIEWHLVFVVSVPFGLFGTVWAYFKLHDTGIRRHARMDWWGNITFAVGLIAVLVGITKIVHLRWKQRLGPVEIGDRLGMPSSTVHAVLVRCRLNRLTHLDRATGEPIRRYQHDHPGDLIHVDVKKLGKVPDGGGWRYVGREQGMRNRSATVARTGAARSKWRGALVGTCYLHTVIDDHSRVAYVEAHDDETAATATAVLRNAVAWFADRNVTVQRVLSDNGSAYKSHLWSETCAELGITASSRTARTRWAGPTRGC